MSDDPLYADANGNIVTRSRAVIAGVTYPIANITSVRTASKGDIQPVGIILGLVGLFIGGSAFGHSGAGAMGSGISGLAIFILGAVVMSRSSAQHYVIIGTSAREQTALTSKDPAIIRAICEALNQAIDSR